MDLTDRGFDNDLVQLTPLAPEHEGVILGAGEAIRESMWRWLPPLPKGTALPTYFDYMLAEQKHGARITYLVQETETGSFAGLTGFDSISKLHRRLRSALAWHPPDLEIKHLYQGGQLAMIERAYAWGARRLEWRVNVRNTYILKELAFIDPPQEAILRQYERMADGSWADKAVFSLKRREMPAVITRLRSLITPS